MLSDKNKVILAAAGSGKTTHIVEEALKLKNQKVLITTYTIENTDQIKKFFIEKVGCIPSNISVQSWFSFLLQEGVRPYQNQLINEDRIESILFLDNFEESQKVRKILRYIPETDVKHYITPGNYIYDDKVSKFIYKCNKRSNGKVIKRLEKIYDTIFIDELQDFAGYDLNVLEMLFHSDIKIVCVGDPRQATFITNKSQKNKQFRRSNVFLWLKEKKNLNEINIEVRNESYRCNQLICDFADKLYSDLPKTISKNNISTEHDGIFLITDTQVNEYIKAHTPVILRYNKKTNTLGLSGMNIGLSKGRTYERTLIFPTKPMLDYLKTNDISKVGDRSKLYIAVTRAKYSVAFVVNLKLMRN